MPFGKYERKSVVTALENYVRAGGMLISGDPEIFSFDVDGSSLAASREPFSARRSAPPCRDGGHR